LIFLNATKAVVRYAFSTVGTAIWVNSAVLIAGFLVLAFSHFHINSGLGTLTAIVIAFALLTDFLLPPLLMKIEEEKDELSTKY
jgi:predicted RND superfamily exporter protein